MSKKKTEEPKPPAEAFQPLELNINRDLSPKPPHDPFGDFKKVIHRMVDEAYAKGYRDAAETIARGVGQLDGEAKASIEKTINLLQEKLDEAEAKLT